MTPPLYPLSAMKRSNANNRSARGAFNSRASKTMKLNKTMPLRGGIRL
ncbi:MAG: hypothetical protein [Microvirus sp.]|nr:MAG: hypothetical protein [Microvirus sp.]